MKCENTIRGSIAMTATALVVAAAIALAMTTLTGCDTLRAGGRLATKVIDAAVNGVADLSEAGLRDLGKAADQAKDAVDEATSDETVEGR